MSSKNSIMEKYRIKIGDQSFVVELEKIGTDDPLIIDPPPDNTGFKVGVNSFPWFPLSKLHDIGMKWQRCYVASGWIWQPGGLAVQPMHQAETAETHGIDDMLDRAKGYGINTLLCIHQTPEWYRNTGRGDGNNDYTPCKAGANRKDPASYKDYAAFLFQVAARYGRVKHPDSSLTISIIPRWTGDVLNVKKSGLDLLNYIECWNEEKWWKNGTTEQEAYLEPETMAALMSACYDGHEGALGAGIGIKTADPSMVVVMPGLSDFAIEYCEKMDKWFRENRKDKAWPCDIYNYHHYSNRGNKAKEYPPKWVESGACMPKDDANFQTVKELIEPNGKKVWITEFGADKKAPSGMHAKGVGLSDEQFQADIIMASIEAYKAAGVDAVFIFNSPDENSGTNGGQFLTSGIFTSQSDGYKATKASEALRAYLNRSGTVKLPGSAKAAELKQEKK